MKFRCIILGLIIFSVISSAFAKEYNFDDNYYERNIKGTNTISIPSGQMLYSRLNADINSQTNRPNELITTQLLKDWVYYDTIIAPEGSLINGRITSIQRSAYAGGNAKVNISFYQVIRPDNVTINIQAKPICITIGDSRLKSGSKMVWEGVKQTVLSSSIRDAADNAIIGAVSGGFVFLSSKGEEVHIPFGTEFRINIINGLNIKPYEN